MTYTDILSDAITKSGMTLRKIEKECYVHGLDISASYLCRIQNGTMYPASDEINQVLEKVLDIEPMKLRVAAYTDKIPKQILPYIIEYSQK